MHHFLLRTTLLLTLSLPAAGNDHCVVGQQGGGGICQGRGVDNIADAGGSIAHLLGTYAQGRLGQGGIMCNDLGIVSNLVHGHAGTDGQAGPGIIGKGFQAGDALDIDDRLRGDQVVSQLDHHIRSAVEELAFRAKPVQQIKGLLQTGGCEILKCFHPIPSFSQGEVPLLVRCSSNCRRALSESRWARI